MKKGVVGGVKGMEEAGRGAGRIGLIGEGWRRGENMAYW